MSRSATPMTGLRFGRLIVGDRAYPTHARGDSDAFWHVVCDCGQAKMVRGAALRRRLTTSCGCYNREKFAIIAHLGRIDGNKRRNVP